MLRKSSLLNIFDYFVIYFAVACSGNPFFLYRNPINNFIVMVVLVLIRGVFNKKKLSGLYKDEALFLMIALILLMISMIANGDVSYTSYINTFSRLIGAFLLTRAFDLADFSKKYVNLITFLAAASVILFLANQSIPQIANFFGELPNAQLKVEGVDYRTYVNGGFLYTFIVSYGYGTTDIWAYTRNNGIFWEPGAYQFFLNFALVLLLEKHNIEEKKWHFLILVVTVLTTGSSTGMLSLVVILVGYHRMILSLISKMIEKYRNLVIVFLGFAFIFIARYGGYLFYAVDKIIRETNNSGYILERIGLSYFGELFNGIHLIVGYGVSGVRRLHAAATLNNTYAYYMFAFGIPYMLTIMLRYFRVYRQLFIRCGVAFVVLILGLSSEVFMLYPIALTLLFWRNEYREIGGM